MMNKTSIAAAIESNIPVVSAWNINTDPDLIFQASRAIARAKSKHGGTLLDRLTAAHLSADPHAAMLAIESRFCQADGESLAAGVNLASVRATCCKVRKDIGYDPNGWTLQISGESALFVKRWSEFSREVKAKTTGPTTADKAVSNAVAARKFAESALAKAEKENAARVQSATATATAASAAMIESLTTVAANLTLALTAIGLSPEQINSIASDRDNVKAVRGWTVAAMMATDGKWSTLIRRSLPKIARGKAAREPSKRTG